MVVENTANQQGFTLVELIVTVAIAALVITVGVPGFQTVINNNRMAANVNEFISVISITRSEAVKRRSTIKLCAKSTTVRECDVNASDWSNGWLVFIDTDNDDFADNNVDVNGDGTADEDELIREGDSLEDILSLTSDGFTAAGRVQYTARGRIDDAGSFVLCDARGANDGRAININITGRPRLATDDDNDGTVNLNGGGELQC